MWRTFVKRLLASVFMILSAAGLQAQNGFIFSPLAPGGQVIAGQQPQPDNHASTVVELKDGDVLAAWFGGTREGAPDVAIYGSRLHQGRWSVPVELAREAPVACWNPVLFHTKNGRLWLYYKFGKSPSTWLGARKWSDDEGRTWSPMEPLPDGVLGPIRAKPLVLADGTIVSGSSVENGKWTVWIERSPDGGKSWTRFGPIAVPEALDIPDAGAIAARAETGPKVSVADEGTHTMLYPPGDKMVGIIQPSIVPLGGQHLRLYARSKSRAAHIAVADSIDNGKTWTQAHFIALPNPSSGIDAVRLRDGRIVLIFNNAYNKRTPLNLAVSRDGEHFEVFKTLEDGPGQYSYPALIQAANGDLLMTYSWRRQTIKFVRLPLKDVPK
jgi:predicted neuraminidase